MQPALGCWVLPSSLKHFHLHLYLALQMGNASNTSVFTSTLSEREDLIFGTLYLVFGKERQPLAPLPLLPAAQVCRK